MVAGCAKDGWLVESVDLIPRLLVPPTGFAGRASQSEVPFVDAARISLLRYCFFFFNFY
ncbi:hypothetical protein BDA96_06G104600 [Sorghum bicolor]|uniref:Uncharacterized protein n=1 Tax=Sorghum bicolor TaxID=4558 RepID=A0A921QQ41_SORBI|nr:hypothetical protein BDA96_06G104600 [Sorghum bicolor]